MQEITAPKLNTMDEKWITSLSKRIESDIVTVARCARTSLEDIFGNKVDDVLSLTNNDGKCLVEVITIKTMRKCVEQNKPDTDSTIMKETVQEVLSEWLCNGTHSKSKKE